MMPGYQLMVYRLNRLFDPEYIDNLNPELINNSDLVIQALQDREVVRTNNELAYLMAWPAGIREAVRAVAHSALTRTPRSPITFAWAPAYDYEVTIWDVAATAESRGGITVLLRSPIPGAAGPPSN
jgi:hypothetical protein